MFWKSFNKIPLLGLALVLSLFLSSARVSADSCEVATSDGFTCSSYTLECGGDTHCSFLGEVLNWYDGSTCGYAWECAPNGPSYPDYPDYPEYSYPSYPEYSYPGYPGYPSYPSYPGYPSYPSYNSYPSYPSYPGYPSYPSYPGYPSYNSYPSYDTYPSYAYPSYPSYTYPSYPVYPTYPSYPAPFNYSLSNSGTASVTKLSGQNAFTQNTVTKTLIAGATEGVTISVSGTPSGVSTSISSNPCNPTCTSTITFTVTPSATVGTHLITVTGSPLGKTTSFNLVITGAAVSLTCTPSAPTITLGQSITWTGSVTGGVPPLTYAWSGTGIATSPAPSTNPYTKTYTTVGQKTALLTVTDADGVVASCPAATAFVNFDPDFSEF